MTVLWTLAGKLSRHAKEMLKIPRDIDVGIFLQGACYLFQHGHRLSFSFLCEYFRRRVGDSAAEKFTLRNRGKYDLAFAFRVRRGLAASLFTVAPVKGVVEAGQAAEVLVTFCSREEAHLKVHDTGRRCHKR